MEKDDALKRDNLTVHFLSTETAKDIPATYTGILPALLRERKGGVAQAGAMPRHFVANEVLAKHDENYVPPDVQHAVDDPNKVATKIK